jgi:Tol biopolymer transport system component/predicted Ser/Thr protein kinase
MALAAGTRLGPYEILALLGAGGMGEVYRARDPRLGRDVAIKISAERFSERFDREARAVAALNHPNICQIYDVGPNYLVMELVEGLTLAERIKLGAVPLDEALAIARQIADALEAAHEKGIVHRDLKPANIKLKLDGVVKVLDFGLAKMAAPAASAENLENSPTLTIEATRLGQILGTAAYMAPEQARGKVVGKQADIWAFGVVLYEMLTGRRLFEGETTSDVLAAVLTKEPDWSRAPESAHRLLKSCLEKDPKQRLRDIGDAWRLLDGIPAQLAPRDRLSQTAAAVLAACLAVALWAPWRTTLRSAEQAATRVDLDLGPAVSLVSTIGPSVILSPDGTRLVFVSQGVDAVRRLFTRRLDEQRANVVPGTEGAYAPFFSPDGQWVAFFSQGKLKKVHVDGGEPVSLCDAPSSRGGSWGDDGNIVAALDQQGGLSKVAPEGGNAEPITTLNLEVGETSHRWPQVLPGAQAVLFEAAVAYGNYETADIVAVSVKDGRRKIVIEHAGMYPRYLPSGHLIYVSKGTLFAVAFDPNRLEARGAATRLGEVASEPNLGFGQLDFARNGTLAYRSGGSQGLRTLEWLDSTGKVVNVGFEPASYTFPRVSPDGRRLLYLVAEGLSQNLWSYDLERGIKTRLTNGLTVNYPLWSPDGQFIVFQSLGGMFWTRADGAGKPEPLMQGKAIQLPWSFGASGKLLAYSEQTPGAGAEVRVATVESSSGQMRAGQSRPLFKTATGTAYPALSPDGRWLAYANAEGGRYEVYVRAFPDNGTQFQISNAGGVMPMWSRTGRELFYRTEDQSLMVASYEVKANSFVAGKPRLWFARPLANNGLGGNFDLAPDGQRFLVLMPAESKQSDETQSHITLVMNFFDEMRRRTGRGK